MVRVSTLISGPRAADFRAKKLAVGVLHAGGPAPGGNQVVYAAALRARDHGVQMVAFRNGYEHLVSGFPKAEEAFYLDREHVRYLRDQSALLIGSSRTNPGKTIKTTTDLEDGSKTAQLDNVLDIFEKLRIGALISIGGDDTMRTANLLQLRHTKLVASGRTFESFQGVVHVPKTIDKDYYGIDYTFGFMSAADAIGRTIKGFHDDARAAGTASQPVYHVVEVMGRAAGWLTAASSIYGQSNLTILPEDFPSGSVSLAELAKVCADLVLTRRQQGEHYGVITVSEGIGELLAKGEEVARDEHGHVRLDELGIATQLKLAIAQELKNRGLGKIKLHDQKAGYAYRQVEPNIFDVLLCQRLGISAIDAVLSGQFGNMISVSGVMTPRLVPFNQLIDSATLRARNWQLGPEEGLYSLLRAMEQPFSEDVTL